MSLPRLLTPASGVPVLSCMGILSSIGSSHELSVLEQGAEEDASEFAKKKVFRFTVRVPNVRLRIFGAAQQSSLGQWEEETTPVHRERGITVHCVLIQRPRSPLNHSYN